MVSMMCEHKSSKYLSSDSEYEYILFIFFLISRSMYMSTVQVKFSI